MPSRDFQDFRSEVLSVYTPPLRRIATLRKMKQLLNEVSALGPKSTADLTPQLVARWVQAHTGHRKPISNQSLLISFRAACTYAVTMGYLAVSPWAARKHWLPDDRDEEDAPRVRHRSIEEIRRILDLAAEEAGTGGWEAGRLQALVSTYAYTGLRKMEALGLKVPDIDFTEKVILIRSRSRRRLKTRRSAAPVPMPPELEPVLRTWVQRSASEWVFPGKRGKCPWTGGSPGRKPLDQIRALGERAGVPGIRIKEFRNSLATHMKRWGFGQLEVKEVLRNSVAMQAYYLESDLDNIRSIGKRITYRA